MRFWILLLVFCVFAGPVRAKDYYFTASDGARLHYTEKGPKGAPILVFVPGWTMPGWIFTPQTLYFDRKYQVGEFDPRGQGVSEVAGSGYDPVRRGEDIGELLDRLPGKVVVVGWSLGVLDTLAYIHQNGEAKLAGLVLIDNSVGENPPPTPGPYHAPYHGSAAVGRDAQMHEFVCGMFESRQSPAYLNRLTQVCLRLPADDAEALLHYPVPREYWKAALLSTDVPVLYVVRPHLQAQAENLQRDRPNTSIAMFPKAGHALFVDEATRFNALMSHFLENSVW